VVAEGIETQNELDDVRAARCDLGQGFFLGAPLPPKEFEDALRHQKADRTLDHDDTDDVPVLSLSPSRHVLSAVDKTLEFPLSRWR
jgi:hypothetical protein